MIIQFDTHSPSDWALVVSLFGGAFSAGALFSKRAWDYFKEGRALNREDKQRGAAENEARKAKAMEAIDKLLAALEWAASEKSNDRGFDAAYSEVLRLSLELPFEIFPDDQKKRAELVAEIEYLADNLADKDELRSGVNRLTRFLRAS